jgi:carboxypeptidase Taq
VQLSLIRTEADELTYHFHVFIRYELEKLLINGQLSPKDIPDYWQEQYKKLLGVEVPDDKQGSLQDVHWSHGSFGYFPTYSIGSLYAAQFYNAAKQALPQLEEDIEKGTTAALLQWLQINIHHKGRFYNSNDLCTSATGSSLDTVHFISYMLEKYNPIYNL